MLKDLLGIKRAVRYSPIMIAGIYLLFSILYIVFSDKIAALYITDIDTLVRVQTLKGIGFVVTTAVVLFWLVRSPLNRVYRTSLSLGQAEEKIRLIFESISEGVAVIDKNYRLVEANPALMHMCGSTSRTQLLGRDVFEFFEVQDRDKIRQDFEQTLTRGNGEISEITLKSLGKGSFPAQIAASVLRDAEGHVIGIVAIIQDITERLRAQTKLRELYMKERAQREELQQESRARGMFIDVLAHELRTPLTPIVASAGMLNHSLSSATAKINQRLINNIMDGSNALARRLEELLDLGRFSRGTFVLVQQRVDTARFLQDVLNRFKQGLTEDRREIRTNIADGLKPVKIDPYKLEQVINVLISNAVKFSPPGTQIQFNAGIEQVIFFFEVADQGIGISKDEIERLFTPYHRTEQDRQKFTGIGLGLTVAKQIVEAHGGKITVSSEIQKGSLFRVEIPLNEANCA